VPSLLDPKRPPAFCPGCAHTRCVRALDRALGDMALKPHQVVIVTDIGCCGLFDTFFTTHAFHGLHGRALTYAAGIKLAAPHLKVIVVMGDGGLGIGGAHFLAACRRNLDMTLLVFNNLNFGMTGGQFSCTTPADAQVSSGFLNTLERPMDVCTVAAAAGAPFVTRCSAFEKDLPQVVTESLSFKGFSVMDIWGLCTGRYTRRNPLKPEDLHAVMRKLPGFRGPVSHNQRPEFETLYKETAAGAGPKPDEEEIPQRFSPPAVARREILLLGSAGGGVITAATILAHAAILAGMHVTQKNDHDVTVMRGPSISELIISHAPIDFTGVNAPDAVLALSPEGINRKKELFKAMNPDGVVIANKGEDIPPARGRIIQVDFKALCTHKNDVAFAAVVVLVRQAGPVSLELLEAAVRRAYRGRRLDNYIRLLKQKNPP